MLIVKMQEFGNRAAEGNDGPITLGQSSGQQLDGAKIIECSSGNASIDDLE